MLKRLPVYLPGIAVFSFALFVRIIYNITVAHGYIPEFDAGYYHTIALHLNSEHCFCLQSYDHTTSRAPFWPFVMAIIYRLVGPYNAYPRLFLCFLGSGTCVLTYLFARDIFNKKVALVVGILAALYPGLFIYDGWLYSESVYTFFTMGFAYSLFRMQRSLHVRWMVSCGVCLACASLTRPNGIGLLLLVLIWTLVMLRSRTISWRKLVQGILVISCLTFGLIAPWTFRNYQRNHHFTLVATGSGAVMAGSYNDTTVTSTMFGYTAMWLPLGTIQPAPTNYTEKGLNGYAYHWMLTHKGQALYLFSQHFVNMWRPYTSEEGLPVREFPNRPSSQFVWYLMNTTPFVIILLAAFGLVVTIRAKWKELLVPCLIIGLTIILCIILYGSSRFRAPIEPLLVLLAGGAVWSLTSTEPGTLRSWFHRRSKAVGSKIEVHMPEGKALSLPMR